MFSTWCRELLFATGFLTNNNHRVFPLGEFYREALLEGLTILKNRGYDSAGIATIHGEGKGPMVSPAPKWLSF